LNLQERRAYRKKNAELTKQREAAIYEREEITRRRVLDEVRQDKEKVENEDLQRHMRIQKEKAARHEIQP